MYEAKGLLEDVAEAFEAFLEPLRAVADDPRGLYVLLTRFNWRLEGLLESDLAPLREGLRLAVEAAQAARDACDRASESEALLDLGPALGAAFESIKALRTGLSGSAALTLATDVLEALGRDLAEHLLLAYLAKRAPELLEIARILGLVVLEAPPALTREADGEQVQMRFPVRRPMLRYGFLETLRSDALAAVLRTLGSTGPALPTDAAGFLGNGMESLWNAFRRIGEMGGDSLEGASATLDLSGIELRSPRLALSEGGPVAVPFPMDHPPTVAFRDGALKLLWLPAALPGPQADVVLFEEQGFRIAVPGVAEDQCPARGLTLAYAGGEVSLRLQGGLRVELPLAAAAAEAEGAVGATVCATLERAGDGEPTLTLDLMRLGPMRARLGGKDGILIEDAGFEMAGIAFTRAAVDPSRLRLKSWGTLSLGDGALRAGFTAEYASDSRRFTLACAGEVRLGDGLRLEPVDADTPVFSLDCTPGEQTVAIQGRMRLPANTGIESVRASGELRVSVQPGAMPRILAFSVACELQGSWELPGGLTLESASAGIAFDGTRFTATLAGTARLTGSGILTGAAACSLTLSGSPSDRDDLRLDGVAEGVSLRFTEQAAVFDATLGLKLRTKPEPGGANAELTISGASGGLFAREDAPSPGGPDGFHLGLEGFSGSLVAAPGQASLTVESGVLLLPHAFSEAAAPGHRPRLDLAAAGHPLKIAYGAPDTVAFEGRVSLLDVGVRFPHDDPDAAFLAHLAAATLDFSSASLPELSEAAGFVTFPLPDGGTGRVDFSGVGWDLRGLPVGTLSLGSDIGIDLGGGFRLSLLHGDPAAPIGPGGTGLTVARIPGSKHVRFLIRAAVRLAFPEAVLCNAAGVGASAAVSAEAAGSLAFASDGALPEADIAALGVGGEFWLGGAGQGLRLTGTEADPDGAHVRASGISYLFNRSLDEAHTFTLALDGAVQFPDGGPRLELKGARLAFFSDDPSVPPKFLAEGFAFSPGERLAESLPITLTKAGLSFRDPGLELPALFGVDSQGTSNLEITLGAAMEFPMGEESIMARVEDVRVALVRGVPRVSLGGIGFLVDDISVGTMTVGGGVYLGGLQGLFSDPPDPSGVFAAGKLAGSISGTGVSGLAAFKLVPPMPLGVSLGVEAGAAGIPLGQTGILFTGASGGISFANSNKSPGDLDTYISLGADGKPKPIPPDPSGRPAAIPPPDTQTINAPRRADKPVEAPGCPCDCPPASMNVFCQPHPDQEQFPGRVILKFSSLTEAFLENLSIPLPSPAGNVSPRNLKDFVLSLPQPGPGDLDALAETLGEALGNGIREAAFSLWPGGAAQVPARLQAMLTATQAAFTARLREGLAGIGTRSLWRLVCDEAYKGLPCPDVTEEFTATFSYAGISSFLSITGGVSISTTGAAGLVGWLNLVGIKVGRLSGFLTVTSRTGEIDPALCGQLLCSVGPLELGSVNAALACRGFLAGLREAVVASAIGAAKPVAQSILTEVAPALASDPLFRTAPESLLPGLTIEQFTAYAGALGRRFQEAGSAGATALDPAEVRAAFTALLQTIWTRFEPQLVLCGKAGPKLFGMQLGSDLVAVKAWAGKRDMGASFAFSPLVLVSGSILGTAAASLFCGFEQAMLGFTLQFPDPVQMLIDGIGGAFRSPRDAEAYAARGFEAILRHSNIVASYRLSPFGMKLVDAGARVVLPDLVDHPAFRDPSRPWRRPPDRLELLGKILLAGKLADSTWDGDLGAVAPDYAGRWLGRDYFPHGGVIGAARLVLPRALTDTPDLETLRVIVQDGEPMPRLQAALKYLKEYLLRMEEAGTFAFYAPAPNPPGLAFRGKPLTAEDLLRTLTDTGFAREVASEQAAPINPDTSAEAFLLGTLNVRLLGIPLAEALMEFSPAAGAAEGHLLITAKAPADSWPHRIGLDAGFTFSVTKKPPLPMDVWFGTFAEALGLPSAGAAGPARPAVEEALAAIASVPRSASDAAALVARLREALVAEAEGMAERARPGGPPDFYPRSQAAEAAGKAALADSLAPSLATVADRLQSLAGQVGAARVPGVPETEQAAAVAGVLARRLAALIAEDMPKVALEAFFRFRLPAEWAAFFKSAGGTAAGEAETRLYAYSPGFDPFASGSPRADAQRLGGAVLVAGLRFEMACAGSRLAFALPPVEFSLTPPAAGAAAAGLPRLRARMELPPIDIPLWGTTLRMNGARLVFDSAAPDGLLLAVEGFLPAFRVGRFGVASASGGPVRARLEARRESGGRESGGRESDDREGGGIVPSLWIEPCRLSLPVLYSAPGSVALALHGSDPDQGMRINADGSLDAGLTAVAEVWVQSPYDPADPPLLRIQGSGIRGTLRKKPAGASRVALNIPSSCVVTAFPGQAWERAFPSPEFSLEASSDGKFRLELSIPALQFGVFRLSGADVPGDAGAIRVRLTQYGFTLDAARLTLIGTGVQALALRRFVINGNGEMRATAKTGSLDIPGFLHIGSAALKLRRLKGLAYLLAEKPKVKLFPGTPMAASVDPGAAIRIDSAGAFSVRLEAGRGGMPTLGVANVFSARGVLSFGFSPSASGGNGPFVVIQDAAVSLPALPGAPEMRATEVAFTPAGARAELAGSPFGVPGLAEIGAFAWSFDYALATRALSLRAGTPSLTLFRIFVCGGEDLNLAATAQSIAFHTGSLVLVPGLFEIGPGEWTQSGTALAYRGEARILSRSLSGVDARFTLAPEGVRAALSRAIDLASVAGVLSAKVPTDTFLLKWDAARRTYSLAAHLQASLFGTAAGVTADIASDGRVTVAWTGSSRFTLGPFRLTTGVGEESRIGFRASDPSHPDISAHMGAGFLRVIAGVSVPGWPSAGAWVNACDLNGNGDFSADLPDLTFAGIDLQTSDTDNYIRLQRSEAVLSLQIRQAVQFLGMGMALTFAIDAAGKVEGQMKGSLGIDFGGTIGHVDFPDVVLGYHPGEEYPFSTVVRGTVRDFLLRWKPGGARACVIQGANPDGSPILWPCV